LQELQKADFSARGKIFESYGIKKAGETFPAEITVSLFEWDGEHHLTFIARDITLKKKVLRPRSRNTLQKLEEKVRERTYELTASQQSLKEKVSELSILNEISEVLASTTDVNVVLNVILAGATSHQGLGFNRAFLSCWTMTALFLKEGLLSVRQMRVKHRRYGERFWGKNLSLRETLQSYTDIDEKTDTHVNNIAKSIRISLADEITS